MGTQATNDAFTDRLSDYLDGEDLSEADRAATEAHLATCASCRTTLEELRAVAGRAASLTDAPPATDLWNGVAARLESRGSVLPFAKAPQRRFSFTLPQLVAAGLALMVLSGGIVTVLRQANPQQVLAPVAAENEFLPISYASSNYDQAVEDLEKVLASSRDKLDPETVRILEANLATIDEAIAQARKALRSDPSNVYLNNHFAESRNRKLALLRRASALAMAQESGGGS
jgi:anti-sigma factor RsiW